MKRKNMDKLQQYKLKVKEDLLDESVLKNASALRFDKEGKGIELDVAGHNVTVICDKELPVVYIAARIDELLSSKIKEIEARM